MQTDKLQTEKYDCGNLRTFKKELNNSKRINVEENYNECKKRNGKKTFSFIHWGPRHWYNFLVFWGLLRCAVVWNVMLEMYHFP